MIFLVDAATLNHAILKLSTKVLADFATLYLSHHLGCFDMMSSLVEACFDVATMSWRCSDI